MDDVHELKLAVVVWKDAFHDPNMMPIDEAMAMETDGLAIMSTGFLLDKGDETVLLAKDFVPQHGLIRNFLRIRRCDIVAVYASRMAVFAGENNIKPFLSDLSQIRRRQAPDVYGIVMEDESWILPDTDTPA